MTDPLTQWLDEMERKARAATPGPWRTECGHRGHSVWAPDESGTGSFQLACTGFADSFDRINAVYIAALPPETVEALLECVRALEYYAECSNYERREMLGGTRPPAVLVERGSRATAALARLRALAGREG